MSSLDRIRVFPDIQPLKKETSGGLRLDDSTQVLLAGVKHSAEICHGNMQMFLH